MPVSELFTKGQLMAIYKKFLKVYQRLCKYVGISRASKNFNTLEYSHKKLG